MLRLLTPLAKLFTTKEAVAVASEGGHRGLGRWPMGSGAASLLHQTGVHEVLAWARPCAAGQGTCAAQSVPACAPPCSAAAHSHLFCRRDPLQA